MKKKLRKIIKTIPSGIVTRGQLKSLFIEMCKEQDIVNFNESGEIAGILIYKYEPLYELLKVPYLYNNTIMANLSDYILTVN